MKNKFLIPILILLSGIFLGTLFSEYIVPKIKLELLTILKRSAEIPPPILPSEKESPKLCQKIKEGIEVSLTEQKLRMCEQGEALAEFIVSTGKEETATPAGEFWVIKKSPMLYSKLANSWLPFWVGFYQDFGFHELPIDGEGKRVGEAKIGKQDSLGCVRLKVGDAEKLYNFAEIGAKIVIY